MPQRRSLELARDAMARDATEVMTCRVQQARRPETEVDDPLAARSTPSPAPTLADVAICPKQKPCESIRITT
ncbi:hypothetical protein [Pseudoxanthomonas spadix]|uniref:hypothetical protein n=1 Tax=Pseudoxanthomonas spadix TaxID=415229 RepID=UPI0011C3503E|nr:hypothetical protein [Pseudoxanthomonas spadix]MBP3975894.1 hypothetical protein [Pseudoxanthomonas spadix]